MRTNLEEIISIYRKADFTDRLSIYLQFRELRNDFMEIEQKDEKTDLMATTDAHYSPRRLQIPTDLFSFGKKHSNHQR